MVAIITDIYISRCKNGPLKIFSGLRCKNDPLKIFSGL